MYNFIFHQSWDVILNSSLLELLTVVFQDERAYVARHPGMLISSSFALALEPEFQGPLFQRMIWLLSDAQFISQAL